MGKSAISKFLMGITTIHPTNKSGAKTAQGYYRKS
jgi:hypothetical protein